MRFCCWHPVRSPTKLIPDYQEREKHAYSEALNSVRDILRRGTLQRPRRDDLQHLAQSLVTDSCRSASLGLLRDIVATYGEHIDLHAGNETLLYLACSHGHVDAVRFLVYEVGACRKRCFLRELKGIHGYGSDVTPWTEEHEAVRRIIEDDGGIDCSAACVNADDAFVTDEDSDGDDIDDEQRYQKWIRQRRDERYAMWGNLLHDENI